VAEQVGVERLQQRQRLRARRHVVAPRFARLRSGRHDGKRGGGDEGAVVHGVILH